MKRLSISYKPEDISNGELTVTVQNEGFAGKSTAWFNIEKLRDFAEALGACPIVSGQEPVLLAGYWKDGKLDDTHVSIRIEPSGPRGKIRIKVILATPTLENNPLDTNIVQT